LKPNLVSGFNFRLVHWATNPERQNPASLAKGNMTRQSNCVAET
jgi:hypothetical protein